MRVLYRQKRIFKTRCKYFLKSSERINFSIDQSEKKYFWLEKGSVIFTILTGFKNMDNNIIIISYGSMWKCSEWRWRSRYELFRSIPKYFQRFIFFSEIWIDLFRYFDKKKFPPYNILNEKMFLFKIQSSKFWKSNSVSNLMNQ